MHYSRKEAILKINFDWLTSWFKKSTVEVPEGHMGFIVENLPSTTPSIRLDVIEEIVKTLGLGNFESAKSRAVAILRAKAHDNIEKLKATDKELNRVAEKRDDEIKAIQEKYLFVLDRLGGELQELRSFRDKALNSLDVLGEPFSEDVEHEED